MARDSEKVMTTAELREKMRRAFAEYVASEGCSCCRDAEAHTEAEKVIGKLLIAKPYADRSGYDWSKYRKVSK